MLSTERAPQIQAAAEDQERGVTATRVGDPLPDPAVSVPLAVPSALPRGVPPAPPLAPRAAAAAPHDTHLGGAEGED